MDYSARAAALVFLLLSRGRCEAALRINYSAFERFSEIRAQILQQVGERIKKSKRGGVDF
jgi:hypothetical protein